MFAWTLFKTFTKCSFCFKTDYVKDYKLTEESTIIYIEEFSSEPDEPATEIKYQNDEVWFKNYDYSFIL